ncbi:Plasmid recombination enzyme [termite gut metagenome]|uniref:Plasmid recombination enzyme n=2 Tax=termite gut metagenome TaxID=433724 RepID=A0A5J4R8S4_9ZZZZ
MGYVVLHLKKASGNDAGTSAHIERTIHPKNADESRTHLNRELIGFPQSVKNRTEAIQHRIENACITRKIGKNQVRAIGVMLSASPDDMKRIEDAGSLNDWCADNVDWLQKTFGADNLVSAVLHRDETTPHIHATIVPIVTGERRKAREEKEIEGKKKYRKKNPDAARLCADDVMARDKLKAYQDSYAQKMQVYGLQRGIEGSEARHITTGQYYRELYVKNEHLKEEIEDLQEQKEATKEEVRHVYDMKDEVRDKFLAMDEYARQKNEELATIETKLQKAKQEYEPYRAQEELNFIHALFPMMKEQLRIADLCRKIGLAIESIKLLFEGKSLTAKSFSFFSPEHNQKFTAEDVRLKIEKEPDNPNKLRLNLNGMNILEWFKQKYQGFQKSIGIHVKPKHETELQNKNKGIKM